MMAADTDRGLFVPQKRVAGAGITASGRTVCRCGAEWSGYKTCHCNGCHQTFTTIKAFDKHRQGSHANGRYCADPSTLGLPDAGRDYPCWGDPDQDTRWVFKS